MLTPRELASLIWLGIAVVVMAIRDPSLAKNIGNFVRLAVKPSISLAVLGFYAYMTAWIWVAAQVGLWNESLTTETVFWGVISGLALLFSATDADDAGYFRKAIRNTFGITVLIEVTFGMVSFPLWVELIIQPVVTILILLEVVARMDPDHHQAASCLGKLSTVFGFLFFGGTVYLIWRDRHAIDWAEQGLTLAMLIWLPLVALPFVYFLAWGMNYGVLVRFVKWRQDDRPVRFRTRAAIIVGFNVGLRHLGQARLDLARQLADAQSFGASIRAVRDYRSSQGNESPSTPS